MLRSLRSVVRTHPKKLLVLILLLLAGVGAGFYAYALHQWELARTAIKEERPNDASKSLDFCLALWPRSLEVHLLAARAARMRGDLDGSEAQLNQCLKLAGGANDDIRLEFLLLRVQQGEVDDVARELLGFVEQKHPESQLILQTLARVYMYTLRYRPAYGVLTTWIKEFPDCAQAYQWRAWVLERMLSTPTEAMKDYQRALEIDENLLPVRLHIVEIYLDRSDTAAARPHLEYLMKQAPDNPEVQARMGQWLHMVGRSEEARRLCEGAVEKLPDDSQLLITLARLDLDQAQREKSPALREGQAARAEKWLRHALQLDPADQSARINLITSLQLQGRAAEAKQELALYEQHGTLLKRSDELLKSEAENPSRDPEPAYEIGDALLRIGQERLGLHWLNEAWGRDPTHLPTNRALMQYYEKKGNKTQAAQYRRIVNTMELRKAQEKTAPTSTPAEQKPKP